VRLSSHALGQRKATLTAKLEDLGDATVDDTGVGGQTRELRIVAAAPGGDAAKAAVFDYREVYRRARGPAWEMVVYAYEYRDTLSGGRRAYHLHDGIFHAHCVDPTAHGRDHHYRAPEMDVFEAHDEFRGFYVAGLTVRCDDLRPALVRR